MLHGEGAVLGISLVGEVGLVTRTQPRYHKLYCRVTRLSNRTASQHPDVQMGLLHDSLPPLLISGETRLGTRRFPREDSVR